MLDILVTVGIILVLIALAALLLHLIGAHHRRDIVTTEYERFHPGNPPERSRGGEAQSAESRERRDEGGSQPPPANAA